jgi:hypothetical protein
MVMVAVNRSLLPRTGEEEDAELKDLGEEEAGPGPVVEGTTTRVLLLPALRRHCRRDPRPCSRPTALCPDSVVQRNGRLGRRLPEAA